MSFILFYYSHLNMYELNMLKRIHYITYVLKRGENNYLPIITKLPQCVTVKQVATTPLSISGGFSLWSPIRILL